MGIIKCRCNSQGCQQAIWFSEGNMWVRVNKTGDKNDEHLIYLDPNALVEIIKEIRKQLLEI